MAGASERTRPRDVAASEIQTPPAPPSRLRLIAGGVLLWLVLPAVWLLSLGAIGTSLNPDVAIYVTPVLFIVLFIGLPLSAFRLARWIYGPSAAADFARARRRRLGRVGPPPPYRLDHERVRLRGSQRLHALALVGLMFVLAFAMWTVAPLGWIWIASQLAPTTQPAMGPYALIIVSVPLTMAVFGKTIALVNARYLRLYGDRGDGPRHSPWLKSLTDSRPVATRTTLELVLIASVVAALTVIAVWFLLFAEMTSTFQQFTD